MPARKIVCGSRGLRGSLPSRKAGRMVAFESRLERDFFLLCEADPDVRTYEEQPITFRFEFERQARRYTPDALVTHVGGEVALVEIKYAADLAELSASERAARARAYDVARERASASGWSFRVVTDREIVGPRLERAQRLWLHAHPPPALPLITEKVRSLLAAGGTTRIETLVARLDHPAAIPCVLHLVLRGQLRDDGTRPVGPSSTVRWTGGA